MCLALLSVSGFLGRGGLVSRLPFRIGGWLATSFLCFLLVSCFAVHAWSLQIVALNQSPVPSWFSSLHFVPMLEVSPYFYRGPVWFSVLSQVLALFEVVFLVLLWFAIGSSPWKSRIGLFVGSSLAIMCILAVLSRGMTSFDSYAYVGDALLGTRCYLAGGVPFERSFAVINHFWGYPFVRCPYGPVWLEFMHVASSMFATVDFGVMFMRFVGVASLVGFCVGCFVLGAPLRFVAVFALDPAVIEQFVVDAHNDLICVTLLVFARIFASRGRVTLAIGLCVLAVLSKAIFVVFALLVFVRVLVPRVAFFSWISVIGVSVILSVVFGGVPYLESVKAASVLNPMMSGVVPILRISTFSGLSCLLVCLFRGRVGPSSPWSAVSFGSAVFPWYLSWGIPFCILDFDSSLPFLSLFPVSVLLLSTSYAPSPLWSVIAVVSLTTALFSTYLVIRDRVVHLCSRTT